MKSIESLQATVPPSPRLRAKLGTCCTADSAVHHIDLSEGTYQELVWWKKSLRPSHWWHGAVSVTGQGSLGQSHACSFLQTDGSWWCGQTVNPPQSQHSAPSQAYAQYLRCPGTKPLTFSTQSDPSVEGPPQSTPNTYHLLTQERSKPEVSPALLCSTPLTPANTDS